MKTPRRLIFAIATALCVSLCSVLAQNAEKAAPQHSKETDAEHRALAPSEIEWRPASPMLPPGAQAAVLAGDPKQAGPFTIRLKLPDGYKVPPHWHPADKHVTVISGAFGIAMGEQFDVAKGKELGVGGFMVMPTGVRHFAWVKGETVIQVHGIGPWAINYVNPADDPRKK
jgi:hypothetical protein